MPWHPHVDAPYAQQAEAPSGEADAEEQRIALTQAERDREIAMRPPTLPQTLYENSKVYVRLEQPVILCDLDDVAVRMQLSQIPSIAAAMSACGVSQLDRSVITAQGPHLEITREISGFLMREQFAGHSFAGIRTISRWQGEAFVLFQDRFVLATPLVGPIQLHRQDADVVQVATMTGLLP